MRAVSYGENQVSFQKYHRPGEIRVSQKKMSTPHKGRFGEEEKVREPNPQVLFACTLVFGRLFCLTSQDTSFRHKPQTYSKIKIFSVGVRFLFGFFYFCDYLIN